MRTRAALQWLSAVGLSFAASPTINVALRSSWPAAPALVELLETVALEVPEAFFPLADLLTDPGVHLLNQELRPEAVYGAALSVAADRGILTGESPAMVQTNLGLHSASPKVEAFYQYYETYTSRSHTSDCGSWVEWYGEVVCDIESLVQLAGHDTIDSPSSVPPKVLPFDHVYPPPERTLISPRRTAILYANMYSSNFRELHGYLLQAASERNPRLEYVFRHVPPSALGSLPAQYLTGYGVALDLKKTDYLAIDDRHVVERCACFSAESSEDQVVNVPDMIFDLIHAYPKNSTVSDPSVPLTEEEILELGFKASQLIADSVDPLATLKQLSQNAPVYASALARRVPVNESIAGELKHNTQLSNEGLNLMWLNGAILYESDINPWGLLRLMRKERKIMESLTLLGLSSGQAIELLTHRALAAAQNRPPVLEGIFDASDRLEGGDVIQWWNNIEKDQRYARWRPSLRMLLNPVYPGQFHNIRLNLFNVVLVLDLSDTVALNFMTGPMSNLIERGLPLRFGVVPSTETKAGEEMARLFYHMIKSYGRAKAMTFFKSISQYRRPVVYQTPTVSWKLVQAEYDKFVSEHGAPTKPADQEPTNAPTLPSIFLGELPVDLLPPVDAVSSYIERLCATRANGHNGHVFVNGKHFVMDDSVLKNIQNEVNRQLQYLQELVYEGVLDEPDGMRIATYFYDLPEANLRRNPYIYPSSPGDLLIVNVPQLVEQSGFTRFSTPHSYLYSDSSNHSVTLYVVADLDSEEGKKLMQEGVKHSQAKDSGIRLSFIHNPTDRDVSPSPAFHENDTEAFGNEFQTTWSPQNYDHAVYETYVYACGLFVKGLGIQPGASALLVNGRVVGPITEGGFVSEDFAELEKYELKRVQPLLTALGDIVPLSELDKFEFADLVGMSSSIVGSLQISDPSEAVIRETAQKPRRRNYRKLHSNYTAFEAGDNTTALYHIAAVIDPLSESAQRWSSLIEACSSWLLHLPDVFIEVHLNPGHSSEMPLKRFYRYNVRPSLSFDDAGFEVHAHTHFDRLPAEPIYTLAMDVPASWIVRPREALCDLDNIQLNKHGRVDALFDLTHLVIDGYARESPTNVAPRGLQLQLSNGLEPSIVVDDTLVMANLGYLQFKARPGVFRLDIRPGRGREIYQLETAGNLGWNSPLAVGNRDVTLTSFEALTLHPHLARLPGMETEEVLAVREGRVSIIDSIKTSVLALFSDSSAMAVPKPADINIFTVASGLLYERFASIMILSVLKHTKSTVKFWFIENFLSPSFLEFIPHFAEEYGFQYELVTYKWPSWLRPQKEKQRIIWAYKILFLDVLFPLDLKKVIFVDADQIVRTDLKELVDLDLHGAPYGYTPMGDDNVEMEGFRFWKTGYWKDFLRGLPYHISALYVVDLVRFRQMAAGDILRGHYQQLSADPNSLSNLDQDLPNNLQHEIPIFSLPEDWLWCETWCSKDRFERAKTIDLCQNPLTKEPKLSRARQIPEWEVYDAEIAKFTNSLAQSGRITGSMAVADTSVLANEAASAPASSPEIPVDDAQSEHRDEL
ncbi:glycosyltransferase family 24 protein [Fistulina hepatica ATCC 64428]|uniref:Glycosyltransferase family 24 protein n=1 Tax=Fistulina hepatica ATCC 64428 TaxID=1128425 RepID=A0A0D7AEX6_9AGAR|nr:glycosyltransferase family 24 protein [Fistulina hepatica ATCC 64428]